MCVQQSDTTWPYGSVCDINIIVLLSSFHGTKVIKVSGFPNEEMLLVMDSCWEMADSPMPVVRVMFLLVESKESALWYPGSSSSIDIVKWHALT